MISTQPSSKNEEMDVPKSIKEMMQKLKTLDKIKVSPKALKMRERAGRAHGSNTKSRTVFSSSILVGERAQTSKTKKITEKEINEVKEMNKQLIESNKTLKASYQNLLNSKKLSGKNQLLRLEEETFQVRRKYDGLKSSVKKLKQEIFEKEKILKSLKTNTFKKEFLKKEKKIRVLENRLDKTIIKYNESLSIKDTYVKILKRLKRERMGFDNQLRSIERTLKAKNQDYEELRQMFHDASYLKEVSKNSLKEEKRKYEEIVKEKKKEVEEKVKYVNSRIELTEKVSKRENIRKKIEMNAKGQLDSEEEKKIHQREFIQHVSEMKNENTLQEKQETLAELEKIWRKIKEVTGVDNSEGIIEKFFSSEGTYKNLQKIAKKGQQKIEVLTKQKSELKTQLASLKYSQSTGIGNKRIVDEFNHQLAESKRVLEKNKTEFEKIKNGILNIMNGTVAINQKLNGVLDIKEEKLSVDPIINENDKVDGSSLLSHIDAISSKVEKLGMKDESTFEEMVLPLSPKNYKLSAYNVRLDLNKKEEVAPKIDFLEEEVDIMDRKQVKKLASLAFQKASLKAQKKSESEGSENV